MADNGSVLTSCIIFYLSIGAAIFQILEEENWKRAKDSYIEKKEYIRREYNVSEVALNEILKAASEAAGQGVAITGDNDRNPWEWGSSVIFTASIVTTIGYGNVAPKTTGGRILCIIYGLFGIPLCLVWVSEVGLFFGNRAKRLSGVMIDKGVSVKKIQFTCVTLFLLWGLLVHLVIPPFVFMSAENWTYLEGFYFSFITLTTVGFGDYVAGVNPDIDYNPIYRVLTELWIYMGLAWLSLFFSWNVHMVVDTHKVLKKKWQKHKHRNIHHEEPRAVEKKTHEHAKPNVVDIFSFMSKEEEDYNTVIKKIGMSKGKQAAVAAAAADKMNRSKSCSDILAMNIQTLEHSPRHRRMISASEVFINVIAESDSDENNERPPSAPEIAGDPDSEACAGNDEKDNCTIDPEAGGISFTVSATAEEQTVQHPEGGETRFTISKVAEQDLLDKDEKG